MSAQLHQLNIRRSDQEGPLMGLDGPAREITVTPQKMPAEPAPAPAKAPVKEPVPA